MGPSRNRKVIEEILAGHPTTFALLEFGADVLIEDSARSALLRPWVGFRKRPTQLVHRLSASQTGFFDKSGTYGAAAQQFRRCKTSNLLASFGVRMLFSKNSVVTGVSSHSRVRCVLPSVDNARPLAKRRLVHHPAIPFRTTTQISQIAGGPYGHQFRPD